MRLSKAGWIYIHPKKNFIFFTPEKKAWFQSSPPTFKAEIGSTLVAPVHTTKPKPKISPLQLPIRVQQTTTNKVRLGPFIGILTSDGQRRFRGNHKNFADLIRMGHKMGVAIFVLTPSSFRKDSHFVQGFLLDPNSKRNRWLKAKLPFPHVIYNRIPDRLAEQQKKEQSILQQLQAMPHIHLFNPSFFDKWSISQFLLKNEEWRYLIPKTKPLNQIHVLKTMTNQYPILYAKPIHEKAGIGLMKIVTDQGQYRLIYQDQQGRQHYKLNSLEQLWHLIVAKKKQQDYILQQGIPLIRYQQRPCDFRILVQKNQQGSWQVTGIGVRVAGKNAISTHVPRGGSIANVHHVLKAVFPKNHDYIYKRLQQTAIGIAKLIEKAHWTPLGEMSMDIGIEKNGRMWFFEANSKPMKFDEPAIRTRSLKQIIDYSLYLSGFSEHGGTSA